MSIERERALGTLIVRYCRTTLVGTGYTGIPVVVVRVVQLGSNLAYRALACPSFCTEIIVDVGTHWGARLDSGAS